MRRPILHIAAAYLAMATAPLAQAAESTTRDRAILHWSMVYLRDKIGWNNPCLDA